MTAVVAIGLSAVLAAAPRPAVPIQRFLLVVGANAGGSDRARLQYAISDAERFARVMVELGGVPKANEVLLRQPKLAELMAALDALSARVTEARSAKDVRRIEVVVYYSGHADEQGLLLAGDRYSYRALRDWLDAIPADVRIAVLDACASGAFTRLKGGKVRPPFLVDESATMRGHAFLTSSAATESAQESDRIRASYFTHYLTSGFRGAADASGDGKVTLNEAYQFAFQETVGRTVDTRGGAQHPSYDINLAGSGDVVMTDLRQTTATIVLGEEIEGRIFVRNSTRELVAEVYKPAGRRVELGVEPGEYDVRLERAKASMAMKARVQDGSSVTLEARQFGPAALEPTRARGNQTRIPFAVNGRHRIDVLPNVAAPGASGIQYTTFPREDFGVTIGVVVGGRSAQSASFLHQQTPSFENEQIAVESNSALLAVPVGVRWNPFAAGHPSSRFKPYVAASIGPVFGAGSVASVDTGSVAGSVASGGSFSQTTVGGDARLGLDFHIVPWFSIGVTGGYNWMGNFSRPNGSHINFGGAEFGGTFGVLFGKGR